MKSLGIVVLGIFIVITVVATYRMEPPSSESRDDFDSGESLKDICLVKPRKGRCRGRIPRYYFDVKTFKCRFFWYSGCDGNSNNFKDKVACEAKCVIMYQY
ncbi:kunitz/Bovine pancreatic trypsin inhibitor domain-containing protein [Phthorimaea operculella]|nr:kunitz/Bovine pancreatic trypsin inhibitor domain-containing protein [Phthorimaea operculella]